MTGPPETSETQVTDGFHVERVIWRNESKIEVELVAIHGTLVAQSGAVNLRELPPLQSG
jgi:hypothetical protein